MRNQCSLEWKKIAGLLGSSMDTLGKSYPNILMPGGGLIVSGLGQFLKGTAGLWDTIQRDDFMKWDKDPKEKAFILIFIVFFKAFSELVKSEDKEVDKDENVKLKEQESLLNQYLDSLQGREFSLMDFDEIYPARSEIFRILADVCLLTFKGSELSPRIDKGEKLNKALEQIFKEFYTTIKSKESAKEAADYIDNLKKISLTDRLEQVLLSKAASLSGRIVYNDFVLESLFVEPAFGILQFDYKVGHYEKEPEWKDDDIGKHIDTLFNERTDICVITAPMGMGKSSFGRMYAANLAKGKRCDRIPVFIELKNFYKQGAGPDTDIYELLKRYLEDEMGVFGFEKRILHERSFLIIFDGIDEIRNIGQALDINEIIRHFQTLKGEDLKIIISSRPSVFSLEIYKHINDQKIPLIAIREFDESRIKKWISKWFTCCHREIPEELRFRYSDISDPALQEDIKTPLMLYMLARVLIDEGIKLSEVQQEKSLRRVDIYQRFIDWTIKKAKYYKDEIHREEMPEGYRALLGEIAYAIMVQDEGEQISQTDFEIRIPPSLKGDYDKLLKTRCIALAYFEHYESFNEISYRGKQVRGHFEFQHKSFREYLAAERILGVFLRASLKNDRDYQDNYRLFLGENTPSPETVEFLKGLIEQVIEVSGYTKDKIYDSFENNGGIPWRLSQIAGTTNPTMFENLDRKIFDIAFRNMQNDRPFIPKHLMEEISAEDCGAYQSRKNIPFAQNSQITAFIVAAHLSRKKFKDEHFGSEDWLWTLIQRINPEENKRYLLVQNLYKLNLKEAYLGGADLRGADLGKANLRGAALKRANLGGANLRQANLRQAELKGADLREADLRKTDLRKTELKRAYLRRTNLGGADLKKAELEGTYLREADLSFSRLDGAIIEGAILKETSLKGTILDGANLEGTIPESNMESPE